MEAETHDIVVLFGQPKAPIFIALTGSFWNWKMDSQMRLQTLLEARWILAILAVCAIVSLVLTLWLSLLFLLLLFCTLAFFRDPCRVSPPDPNLVVGAADGTVTDIVELDDRQVLQAKMPRLR